MSDPRSLADEVVVVTGGARGIGASIAAMAAARGARVAVLDRDHPEEGSDVLALRADVRDAEAVGAAVAIVRNELGPVTVLVNNAGRNAYFDPVEMTEDQWDQLMSVDLKAAWLCARAVLPGMRDERRGSIVNIASLHAKLTTRGMFPYAAAKSGLIGLTRSLALEEAAYGVRVNAVSPGYIRTALVEEYFATTEDPDIEKNVLEVHPFGRIGDPDEVAQVVCFLASEAASYVTGADWAVDGGLGIRFA